MATTTSIDETSDVPTQSFYLPALPTLSAEPGWFERLLTRYYHSHRRFVRQTE